MGTVILTCTMTSSIAIMEVPYSAIGETKTEQIRKHHYSVSSLGAGGMLIDEVLIFKDLPSHSHTIRAAALKEKEEQRQEWDI